MSDKRKHFKQKKEEQTKIHWTVALKQILSFYFKVFFGEYLKKSYPQKKSKERKKKGKDKHTEAKKPAARKRLHKEADVEKEQEEHLKNIRNKKLETHTIKAIRRHQGGRGIKIISSSHAWYIHPERGTRECEDIKGRDRQFRHSEEVKKLFMCLSISLRFIFEENINTSRQTIPFLG